MCGIAVIINPTKEGIVEIAGMLKRIEHRGDAAPVHRPLGNALLGSVRLKIVDSLHGGQPVFNEDGKIGVVFNGELYNYKQLRAELETKGHRFTSASDTEILVHLYEEYGTGFLEKLEGMFAFLIYDAVKEQYFGARDFFGVKPFFYCRKGTTLYIASEMKSFIDLDTAQYEELKPGHYMTTEGVCQYYQTPVVSWNTAPVQVATAKIRALLEAAVKKRVDTEMPIATFLSGGVDSTIVHLLCCKYHPDVTALIVGEDTGEDVLYARRFCEEFNLKYQHIRVDKAGLLENVPDVIYTIETFEPNAVRGSLLSMKLAEAAHMHGFKVVLCGEGSDEIFGGYGDFMSIKNDDAFRHKIADLLDNLYRTQLLRIDKTAMKYSVEVREPFLDRELVEYVLNLHPSLKVARLASGEMTTKFILREAFRDVLPDYIYSRKKMTLMEGAGTGGVERGKGLLYEFAGTQITDSEYATLSKEFAGYDLKDKEEAYCFKIFDQYYSRAHFARSRVVNAQVEIQ